MDLLYRTKSRLITNFENTAMHISAISIRATRTAAISAALLQHIYCCYTGIQVQIRQCSDVLPLRLKEQKGCGLAVGTDTVSQSLEGIDGGGLIEKIRLIQPTANIRAVAGMNTEISALENVWQLYCLVSLSAPHVADHSSARNHDTLRFVQKP
jgi:hypothetical protein